MKDAELAEKLFALAGRLLDADTIGTGPRALEVARVVAELARTIAKDPDETVRTMGVLFLSAEGAAEQHYEQLQRARSS
jgi:hypothetical protein